MLCTQVTHSPMKSENPQKKKERERARENPQNYECKKKARNSNSLGVTTHTSPEEVADSTSSELFIATIRAYY
jgi:hypothetical protein